MAKFYVVVIGLLVCFITNAQSTQQSDYKAGQLFVKVNDQSDKALPVFANAKMPQGVDAKVAALITGYNISDIERPFFALKDEKMQRTYLVKFSTAQNTDKLIKAFEKLGYIEYAERVPDYKVFTPNDPSYNIQWSLQKVHAPAAWAASAGTGPVVIAVVDDEVMSTHQDLQGVIWQNTGEIANNNIDDDGNGYIDDVRGYDVADNDNNPDPLPNGASTSTHGTHVSGIAGASTNNALGIASLANGAAGYNQIKIMPVKVQSDSYAGQPVLNNPYAGVAYAIAAHANVVNMSWGGGGYSTTYQNLFNTGHNAGITFVAAAGNSNSGSPFYPAAYNNIISVASTDAQDAKSGFSNYGPTVDIAAPGSNIFSSVAYSTSSYASFSGTSMASPLVASACALLKLKNPNYTPDQIEACLKAGADNIDGLNPTYAHLLGAGRLNAQAALACTPCTASAGFTTGTNTYTFYVNSNVQFNAASPTGNTFSWLIDGSSYTGTSVSHVFTTPGYYPIQCAAQSIADNTCRDTATRVITIIDTISNACLALAGANWFFGHHAGLTFKTTPPSVIPSSLHAQAGSTTVSNSCGEVAFYTNGLNVYDRNNNLMPASNTVHGDTLSYTVLAVPKPGSAGVFGLFVVRRTNINNPGPQVMQLFYNEVDMSLPGNGTVQNPLGDISYAGTIPIDDSVTEKMTIIRHVNGIDYWFIIHEFGNNLFKAFLYDHNGLSTTPVTSAVGSVISYIGAIGANYSYHNVEAMMKPSLDGTRFALAHYRQGDYTINTTDPLFEVFDFDAATGVASHPLAIYKGVNNYNLSPYSSWSSKAASGVEFSPNGKYLYGVLHWSGDGSSVVQYDLTAGDSMQINNSYKYLAKVGLDTTFNVTRYHSMQRGPDGKIYVSRISLPNIYVPTAFSSYLSVINNPDLPATGNQCGYAEGQVYLDSGFVLYGLSNFSQAQFQKDTLYITSDDSCADVPVNFTTYHTDLCQAQNITYHWTFGDPATGSSNSSFLKNPIHAFSGAGTFVVKLVVTSPCKTDSVTKTIKLNKCYTCDASSSMSINAIQHYCQTWPTYVGGQTNSARLYKWIVDGTDLGLIDSLNTATHNFYLDDSLAYGPHDVCLVSYADYLLGCKDSACLHIFIDCGPVQVGVNSVSGENEIYNLRQAGRTVFVDYNTAGLSRQLNVFNTLWQPVLAPTTINGVNATIPLNLQNLAAGVYVIAVTDKATVYTRKFILY